MATREIPGQITVTLCIAVHYIYFCLPNGIEHLTVHTITTIPDDLTNKPMRKSIRNYGILEEIRWHTKRTVWPNTKNETFYFIGRKF